jgi:hypothetical protein
VPCVHVMWSQGLLCGVGLRTYLLLATPLRVSALCHSPPPTPPPFVYQDWCCPVGALGRVERPAHTPFPTAHAPFVCHPCCPPRSCVCAPHPLPSCPTGAPVGAPSTSPVHDTTGGTGSTRARHGAPQPAPAPALQPAPPPRSPHGAVGAGGGAAGGAGSVGSLRATGVSLRATGVSPVSDSGSTGAGMVPPGPPPVTPIAAPTSAPGVAARGYQGTLDVAAAAAPSSSSSPAVGGAAAAASAAAASAAPGAAVPPPAIATPPAAPTAPPSTSANVGAGTGTGAVVGLTGAGAGVGGIGSPPVPYRVDLIRADLPRHRVRNSIPSADFEDYVLSLEVGGGAGGGDAGSDLPFFQALHCSTPGSGGTSLNGLPARCVPCRCGTWT